jgi:hypothetical protein
MANRFWVGGTGTWDASSTANWSATTGGASGASAPTSGDAVFFNANSGSGTCTTASGSACAAATLDSATLNLVLGANHTCSGAFTLTQGSLNLANNILASTTFSSSTTNTRSVDFGTGKIQVTSNSLTLILLTTSTNLTVTGSKLIEATYAGAVGTRTFAMASSTTGTKGNVLNLSISAGTDIVSITTNRVLGSLDTTGFAGTLNANSNFYYGNFLISSTVTIGTTTQVSLIATSGTKTITTSGKTFDFPLVFNGAGGTFAFQDALTQGSTRAFTITNGTVQLKAGATSTVGAFATSGTNQKFLQSTLAGTQATLSQVTGIVSVGYLTIKDINATGGATFNAYTVNSNVNAGNNLGWDFFAQLGKTIFTRRKEKRVLI